MTKAKSILFIFVVSLCFVFSACTGRENVKDRIPDYNNTVAVLDVGQAACTLIESEGQFALIDAGDAGGSTNITAYLRGRGVSKIDYMFLSHFHYDHTSEALDIIRNFEIGTVVIPALSEEMLPQSYFYESLWADAAGGYYAVETAAKDKSFPLGRGEIKVLADTINTLTENDTSLALSYTDGDFVYVNTADMEKEAESAVLEYIPCNITLFVAGHHGSYTSNSPDFIARLNPQHVIISCGEANDYGHPSRETLNTFDSLGIPYSITYEKGNIVYHVDSGKIFTEQ